jgi:hypothetical protein
VDDHLGGVSLTRRLKGLRVGDVDLAKRKPIAIANLRKAIPLQLRIIIRVEAIEATDLMAPGQQDPSQMKSYEPCDPCEENSHDRGAFCEGSRPSSRKDRN